MNRKKLFIAGLVFAFALPILGLAFDSTANPPAQPAPAQAQQDQPRAQEPQQAAQQPEQQAQPQTRRERRSYEREVNVKRHHGISKKEVIFLAAVAGTPMGIGAIAGGAHGLAIGAVVGGWSAYAVHRLWRHIR